MPLPTQEPKPQWNPHAAAIGWLIPGLGHWILGMRTRGMILCATITSLWLSGILIGGIGVIDRIDKAELPDNVLRVEKNAKTSWWFFGQALIAPSILVDLTRSSMYDGYADEKESSVSRSFHGAHPNEVLRPVTEEQSFKLPPEPLMPPYEPSIARVAEQGTLFTALAGLLNLLAMIDVLYCDPKFRRQRDAGEFEETSQPVAEAA